MFCNSLVAGISLLSHNKDFKIKPLQCVWYCCVSGDASLQQLPVAQYVSVYLLCVRRCKLATTIPVAQYVSVYLLCVRQSSLQQLPVAQDVNVYLLCVR